MASGTRIAKDGDKEATKDSEKNANSQEVHAAQWCIVIIIWYHI